MKMNCLTLSDSDTAHLQFNGLIKEKGYQITILVVEDLPRVSIKQNGEVILLKTLSVATDVLNFRLTYF
jgi:hypothetical protein